MTDLAHGRGDTSHPLIEATIGQFFDATCARYPDVDALISVHQDVRMTYAGLREKVDALAVSLRRLTYARFGRGIRTPSRPLPFSIKG